MNGELVELTRAFRDRKIDRRNFLRGIVALGVSMPVALAILEACGSGTTSSNTKASLVIESSGVQATQAFDPAQASVVIDGLVVFNTYQSLLRINPDDPTKPYPSVATGYTISSDHKTYTFTLDKSAVFSDGTPIAADDVVFSLTRNHNLLGGGQVIPDGMVVTAADPHTVLITVQQPDPASVWYVAHIEAAILNSKIVMQHGGTDAADANKTDTATQYLFKSSAGSGPYILDSVDLPNRVALKANPHYWRQKPVYQRVILSQADPSTQLIDLEKNTAQVAIDLTTSDLTGLPSSINVGNGVANSIQYIAFNTRSPIAVNPGFREAVRYGIDYDGLLKIVQPSKRIAGYIPGNYLGGLPASEATQRDVNRAKAALATAGLTNPTIPFEFVSDVTIGGLSQTAIASKIQADLKEVGINLVLAGAPSAVEIGRLRAGLPPMITAYANSDFPDPSFVQQYCPDGHLGARYNWHVGRVPTVDAACAAAARAFDPQQRATAYQALQRALAAPEYNAFIPLFQLPRIVVAVKDVSNLKVDPANYLNLGDLS